MKLFKPTFSNLFCIKEPAKSVCDRNKSADSMAIRNYSGLQRKNRHFVFLLSGLFLILLQGLPAYTYAQKFAELLTVKAGVGVANQTWRFYGSDHLKINGESIKRHYFSVCFESELTNMFKLRNGLSYKMKGTKNIRTRNANYKSLWPSSVTNPVYITNNYAYDVLSAFGSLLFYPFGPSEKGLYLSTGFGVDYIISKKPIVHDRFPYDVQVYFDQKDYKRASIFGTLGLGRMLAKGIHLEIEYAPSITRSLNVRQMHITESFWSVSLVMNGRLENND